MKTVIPFLTPELLPFHPVADLFPMMQGDEFDDLVADIQQHGLCEPIWLYEGKILDGRNRLLACQEAGVKPVFQKYEGNDPRSFSVSLNMRRRHLSNDQRKAIAAELANIEDGDKAPFLGNQYKKGVDYNDFEGSAILPPPRISNKKASEIMQVSERSLRQAKQIKKNLLPELYDKVKAGKLKLPLAKEISTFPEEAQSLLVELNEKATLQASKAIRQRQAEERRQERIARLNEQIRHNVELDTRQQYPVIYADPPWAYEHCVSDSRHLDNQYPTLDLEAIKALPVSELASPDSVLFLWVTSPKVPEGMAVLEAWNFTYKTCAVWDKERIGMGYWFRQQSELLMVGTRGTIPPPRPECRPPSVIRSPRKQHSCKPERVYEIIEAMYPELPRIELFARQRREGWSAFGNESDRA